MPSPRVAITLLSLHAAVSAQAAPASEAEFDAGLAAVHSQMQKGKWSDARASLLALLKAHANQVYVQAQGEAIVSDLRTCAFYAVAKPPKMADLITGRIASYDERTGRIRVVYDDSIADWKPAGEGSELLVNPLVFAGNYTITVSGKSYPGETLHLCFDLDPAGSGWFVAGFGSERQHAIISQGGGDGEQRVISQEKSPAKVGKPFTAVVRVGEDRIKLMLDNKAVIEIERKNIEFGQVGLWKAAHGEVALEGRIEPSCLQSRVDDELAKQRETFEKTFDAKKELPAWVFERPRTKRTPPRSESWVPGRGNFSAAFEAMMELLAQGKRVEANAALAKLGDGDAPAVTRTFLTGWLHVELGRPELAEPVCAQLLTEDAQMTQARLLRAQAFEAMGRGAEAITELEATLRDDPGCVQVYEQLCVVLLRKNRVDAARRLVRDAKTKHGMWEDMARLDQMLAMAARGPSWPRRFSYRSAHYEVVSDIDSKVCFDACQVLEASYVNLMSQLTWIKEDKSLPPFRVFLFSGESGYQEYNKSIIGEAVPHSAGLYTPVLKQLLIWNLPRREDMVRTIRHEGFHQFLDRVMENPPTWLNEGTAEFWETAQRVQGRMQGGQVRTDHLATLARSRKALPKLQEFVYGGRADFYGSAQLRYAQAWALVHFLRKGPPVHTARFDKLWAELRSAKSTRAALDAAFAGVDWGKLEQEFWQHVGTLR